ncbi:MAG: pyrroline-5-carboxylate reductase [Nitrospirae bacterium]|nr:pyrroline-5-carboxylate reductase [Nitrospirota bacterium]
MTGFIGGGNMADALIKGMLSKGMKDIIVSEPRPDRRKYLEDTYLIKTTSNNLDVIKECNIIILAVKPQQMEEVLNEIRDSVTEEKTVVSIAAGITLSYIQSKLKTKRLVCVMPNVGAFVGEGMSVISLCECFDDKDIRTVRDIFMSVGKVITLPEKYIDAVTALSGSGPAFIAYFIEAMIDTGVKIGIKEEDAVTLTVQTALATARLLEEGMTPKRLMEIVTSPGGTTEAGLKVFEEKHLREIVEDALNAAVKRAKELSK